MQAIEKWDQHVKSVFWWAGQLWIADALFREFLVYPSKVAHHSAPARNSQRRINKTYYKLTFLNTGE